MTSRYESSPPILGIRPRSLHRISPLLAQTVGKAAPDALIFTAILALLVGLTVGYVMGGRSARIVRPVWFLRGRRHVPDESWNDPRFWSEQAEQAFDRAISHGERRSGGTCLQSFDEEVAGRTLSREDRGFRTVPIDDIVGSVGKACWFTSSFDPKREADRSRWKRAYATAHGLVGYEPIDLYQLGGRYFVIDGHFRVSVARSLGAVSMAAHVEEWC